MGQTLRGRLGDGGEGGRTLARDAWRVPGGAWFLSPALFIAGTLGIYGSLAFIAPRATHHAPPSRATRHSPLATQADAPLRLDRGRFTVVCYPGDERLASSLLDRAVATDTFPGLPRPSQKVLIAIAPDARRFHEWAGVGAPEWGSALAFPESRRVVMQGRSASSDVGNPFDVLRHELAHLALHEYLGDLTPRWFDEGYASYAARELGRNEVLAANFALVLRGMPTFDELDDRFTEGATSAQAAYALAYRAVDDMASIDPIRGLALLFRNWKQTGSLDRAMRAAFGVTLASFEHDWQRRTRRRYGGLAVFSDLTFASIMVLLIVTPLYIARRRRDRRRMAALVAADALAERPGEDTVFDSFLESDKGPSDGAPSSSGNDEGQNDGLRQVE